MINFQTLEAHILDVHALIVRLSGYGPALNRCMHSQVSQLRVNGCTAVQLTAVVSSMLDRAASQFGYQISDLHGKSSEDVRAYLKENQPDIERQFAQAFPSMAAMFGLTAGEMEQSLLLSSLMLNQSIEDLLDEIEKLISETPEPEAAVATPSRDRPAANDSSTEAPPSQPEALPQRRVATA